MYDHKISFLIALIMLEDVVSQQNGLLILFCFSFGATQLLQWCLGYVRDKQSYLSWLLVLIHHMAPRLHSHLL